MINLSSSSSKSSSNIIISRILIFLFLISIEITSAVGFTAIKTSHLPNHLRSTSIQSESSNIDMPNTKYSWTKPTLQLALPALVASISEPLLALMDTAYIGKLGKQQLAALGVCTSIFYISFYGFLATKTATMTLVASSDKEARLVTMTSLQLGLSVGVSVLLFLRLRSPQCLAAMGIAATSDIFPHALTYLHTRCLSAPFFLLITVAEGAFRGFGDTKIPLLASMATALTMASLEPLLVFTLGWHMKGSAAAMALSQVSGALVYCYYLRKHFSSPLIEQSYDKQNNADTRILTRGQILLTIIKANASMIIKQGSLLFTWAFAAKSAAKFGAAQVAAHQVALSFWMVFAYILDAVSVSAQILLSKARARKKMEEVRSITKYMTFVATAQGLIISLIIAGFSPYVPSFFTADEAAIAELKKLLPVLLKQQVIISLTFVAEALAAGGSQFTILGTGTAISAIVAVILMSRATSVLEIWTRGILAMFLGRFAAASIGVLNVNGLLPYFMISRKENNKAKKEQ